MPAPARGPRLHGRGRPVVNHPVIVVSAVLTAAVLAVGVISFAVAASGAIRSHGELDYGEGVVLWQAAHATDFKIAYRRLESAPYMVFHYPPLYLWASRAVAVATGDLLQAGRLVSSVSLALTCCLLGFLAAVCFRRSPARYVAAFIGATLMFTMPTWPWALLMKMDTLGILLEVSGLALFVASLRRPLAAFPGFLCFVAALFCKQSLVAAPAACLVVAFLERPRRAFQLAAFAGSVGLAAIAILQYATAGGYLVNTVRYNMNPFSIRLLVASQVEHIVGPHGGAAVPLAFAAVGVALLLGRRFDALRLRALASRFRGMASRGLFGRCLATSLLFFCFAAATTLTAGKFGSNYHYFFEMDIALTLLCALGAGAIVRRAQRSVGPYGLILAALCPFLALHSLQTIEILPRLQSRLASANARAVRLKSVFDKVPDGLVYTDAMTDAFRAGKQLAGEPAIVSAVTLAGVWDAAPFVRDLEDGRIAAIVATGPLGRTLGFTPAMRNAIERRYRVDPSIPDAVVLVPQAADEPAPK